MCASTRRSCAPTSSRSRSSSARAKPMFDQNREQFHQFLNAQAAIRGLPAVMMLDKDLNVDRPGRRAGQPEPSSSRRARRSPPINETEPQIGDVPRRQLRGRHHQAARLRRHLSLRRARCSIRACVAQLRATAGGRRPISPISRRAGSACRSPSRLMYTVIALIVLLSAVWIGLNFANYLVAPIRRLIGAAQVVSTGNLYVQVPTRRVRGRPRPARRDLQQDDAGAAHPARRHRARARPDRQPPPLHRGGAGGRQRRRHRRRRRRPHQHPQPLGRAADRPAPRPRRSGSRSPRSCRSSPSMFDDGARRRAAPGAGPGHASAATAASATCRCA